MKTILRRLAPAAIVVAFLASSALPAQAAAWVWQAPQPPDSTYHCGASKSVPTPQGELTIQECVIVHRSPGVSYYQGLLKAYFTSTKGPTRREALSGRQTVSLGGHGEVDRHSCGSVTLSASQGKWCFSPTRATSVGPLVSANGYISSAGREYQVTASAST